MRQLRSPLAGRAAIPIVFAVVSLAITFNQIRVDPINSIIGLGMVLVGLPVYLMWSTYTGSLRR